MNARVSSEPEAPRAMTLLRNTLQEGSRYLIASAAALALDAGVYLSLIRLGGVHYLAAAPAGFVLGVAMIYVLSIRWVFRERRLSDARSEFVVFILIGAVGLLLNEAVIYMAVENLSQSYEYAKALSAAIIFGVNFISRKLILFTQFGSNR